MNKERRYIKSELRADIQGDQPHIQGYAAKFNVLSEDLGGWKEIILPDAFDLANSPDIICNFDHDDCRMLGRTTSGTLAVTVDDIGLRFDCSPPDTSTGRDVSELIRRGDLDSCSFCFFVADDGSDETWVNTSDGLIRQIHHMILADVSIVVHPAYPLTEVGLRSLQAWRVKVEARPLIDYAKRLLQLHEKFFIPKCR